LDNLTHALIGLTINNLLPDTKRNSGTFWISLTASELPDVDILYRLKSATDYMLNHRGISHSIVAMVIFAGIITLISKKTFPDNRPKLVFLLALGCLGLHVLFDLFTSWGTQFLTPFNNRYFYLDYLPIADLVIIALLLFFLGFSRLIKFHRNKIAFLALFILCGFVFARAVTHNYLVEYTQRSYPGARVAVLPGFSPLHWKAIVESDYTLIKKDIVLPGMESQRNMNMVEENQVSIEIYQDNDEFNRVVNFFRKPVFVINGDKLVVRDIFYNFREVIFQLNNQGKIIGRAISNNHHTFTAK